MESVVLNFYAAFRKSGLWPLWEFRVEFRNVRPLDLVGNRVGTFYLMIRVPAPISHCFLDVRTSSHWAAATASGPGFWPATQTTIDQCTEGAIYP